MSLYPLAVDFLTSLIAIDTDDAALVVLEVTLVSSVVHFDVILAILVGLMPPFAVGVVVIVEEHVVSEAILLHKIPLDRDAVGLNVSYCIEMR